MNQSPGVGQLSHVSCAGDQYRQEPGLRRGDRWKPSVGWIKLLRLIDTEGGEIMRMFKKGQFTGGTDASERA